MFSLSLPMSFTACFCRQRYFSFQVSRSSSSCSSTVMRVPQWQRQRLFSSIWYYRNSNDIRLVSSWYQGNSNHWRPHSLNGKVIRLFKVLLSASRVIGIKAYSPMWLLSLRFLIGSGLFISSTTLSVCCFYSRVYSTSQQPSKLAFLPFLPGSDLFFALIRVNETFALIFSFSELLLLFSIEIIMEEWTGFIIFISRGCGEPLGY